MEKVFLILQIIAMFYWILLAVDRVFKKKDYMAGFAFVLLALYLLVNIL